MFQKVIKMSFHKYKNPYSTDKIASWMCYLYDAVPR